MIRIESESKWQPITLTSSANEAGTGSGSQPKPPPKTKNQSKTLVRNQTDKQVLIRRPPFSNRFLVPSRDLSRSVTQPDGCNPLAQPYSFRGVFTGPRSGSKQFVSLMDPSVTRGSSRLGVERKEKEIGSVMDPSITRGCTRTYETQTGENQRKPAASIHPNLT